MGISFFSCKHTFTIKYLIFSHLTLKNKVNFSVCSVLTWTLISIGGVGIWKYCLQKKSFPFNLFLPFPPLSPWKWGQRPQGALREPAAENENSHLEISAESYKLLYKDQLSLGHYGLWFFTLIKKVVFFSYVEEEEMLLSKNHFCI